MGGLFAGIIFSGIPGAAFVYIATSCIVIAVIAAFLLLGFAVLNMSNPAQVTPMSTGRRMQRSRVVRRRT
jgi:hypothetical protein